MHAEQQRVLASFRRVVDFIEARPALTSAETPEGQGLAARVEVLKGVVTRATDLGIAQHVWLAKSGQLPTETARLKTTLIDDHLQSIAKVARGLRGVVPGIGVLKVPSRQRRHASVIEAATTFAQQAEIYLEPLTEHGLSADAITQLRAAIAAFQASIDGRSSARAELRGATAGVAHEMALGRAIVTGMDGLIPPRLRKQPEEIAVWQAAKRVGRGPGRAGSSSSTGVQGDIGAESIPSLVQAKAPAAQAQPLTDERAA